MKKRDHQDTCTGAYGPPKGESSSMSKSTTWDDDQNPSGAGMDELLAVLGYKVRSSDMADVAHKLEQLEMVMGSAHNDDDAALSHLQNDAVHYNPSDLSSWVQTMLSELNPTADHSMYDLRAIPGVAAYPPPSSTNKRLKNTAGESASLTTNPSSSSSYSATAAAGGPDSTRPVVIVDSQETGVRLVHTLMACAEAIQQENLKLADTLVKHVGVLSVSLAGAMRKVADYFAEALVRRIYKIYPHDSLDSSSYNDILQMHFYESCPYLKFAHFTANQAILEAFGTAPRVHVIDFSLKQGMQWPALMQALALRPGGPPAFRLTGIGPPQPDNTDALQQVGWKLAQLAETIGVDFEFRGFVTNSLADLNPGILDLPPPEKQTEVVAVNSVFEFHRLLGQAGAMDKVLKSIKAMKPKIVTMVEQEANHNSPVFVDRFNEALHYYSSLFDSLEGSGLGPSNEDMVMSEVFLGRQICNVVSCEGEDRLERHEPLTRWRDRMVASGFEAVHLGSNAFKQASMLLALFAGGDGYRVEENDGALMLGWHTRPLIATSAWRPATTATR